MFLGCGYRHVELLTDDKPGLRRRASSTTEEDTSEPHEMTPT